MSLCLSRYSLSPSSISYLYLRGQQYEKRPHRWLCKFYSALCGRLWPCNKHHLRFPPPLHTLTLSHKKSDKVIGTAHTGTDIAHLTHTYCSHKYTTWSTIYMHKHRQMSAETQTWHTCGYIQKFRHTNLPLTSILTANLILKLTPM